MIVRSEQAVVLNVCNEVGRARLAMLLGLGLGKPNESVSAIDSDREPQRTDLLVDDLRRVAKPTAYVEHSRSRGIRALAKRARSVLRKSVGHDTAKPHELVE